MRSSSPPWRATCSVRRRAGACSTHAARMLRNGCSDTPVSSQRPYTTVALADDTSCPGERGEQRPSCRSRPRRRARRTRNPDVRDERELARERLQLFDASDERGRGARAALGSGMSTGSFVVDRVAAPRSVGAADSMPSQPVATRRSMRTTSGDGSVPNSSIRSDRYCWNARSASACRPALASARISSPRGRSRYG